MTPPRVELVIFGAGGHAAVLVDSLLSIALTPTIGLLDNDPDRWHGDLNGAPILGGDDELPGLVDRGAKWFAVGVGSTGSTALRQRIFTRGLQAGLAPYSIIHPSATVSRFASVAPGCQILPRAVVNAGARLGQNVIVNTAAVVEHDCHVDDHVHVASGAICAGGVRVGIGAHIGAGATIRQGARIGPHAIVGAGAVVVCDVLEGTTVVGVPARVLLQRADATLAKAS